MYQGDRCIGNNRCKCLKDIKMLYIITKKLILAETIGGAYTPPNIKQIFKIIPNDFLYEKAQAQE